MPVPSIEGQSELLHRLAYPPAEVAQLLGLGRSKTLALIAAGTIPSVKIDRARRVLHSDLVAYVDSLRGES